MGLDTVGQYIEQIEIRSLRGRAMRMPATVSGKNSQEILLLYGQHANLERMTGIAEVLRQYGNVTVPDLPGFGGMQSFYTIGSKPTLDNLADYLAEFIQKEYPAQAKLRVIAMSFSFLIVTRMLQLHPELSARVATLVSFVGFLDHGDFHVSRPLYWTWRTIALLSENKLGAWVWKHIILQPLWIRAAYTTVAKIHPKMRDASKEERAKRIDFEIKLWQVNDFRTRMYTLDIMLTTSPRSERVPLPVYHVAVDEDFYFDNKRVEQHMRQVYDDFIVIPAAVTAHSPTIIATAEEAAPFIPPQLVRILQAD